MLVVNSKFDGGTIIEKSPPGRRSTAASPEGFATNVILIDRS
jgi:hypothetical protein